MKKIPALILCALCWLFLLSPAMGEGKDATLPVDYAAYGSFFSTCLWRGSPVLLTSQGIFRWEAGREAPEKLMDLAMTQKWLSPWAPQDEMERELWEQGMGYLFTDGESLFGLHPYTGQVFRVEGETVAPYARIPEEQFFYTQEEQRVPKEIKSLFFFEGKLYMALMSFTFEKGDSRELFTWDMQAPAMVLLNAEAMENAYPGPKGELLLKLGGSAEAVWRYDLQTQALTQKVWEGESVSGCVWREADNTLYFAGETGKVQKVLPGGKTQIKAYLPLVFGSADNAAFLMEDETYVYLDHRGLFARNIAMAGEREQTVVRVMGLIDDTAAVAFSAKRPDISLNIDDGIADFLSIQQSMVSGDSATDLYVFNTARAFGEVKEKGYAAPMNANPVLTGMAGQFYPAFREALFDGDNLIAFPMYVRLDTWTLNRTVWNRLNLGEYPVTFAQVFEKLEQWTDLYADGHPEYAFIENHEGLRGFVAMIVKQYLLGHETKDAPVRFDDPAFMEAAQAALDHREALSVLAEGENPIIMLYHQYLGVGANDSDVVISIPLPALGENSPRMMQASMEVLVLNPLSKNQEAALDFVAFCAQGLDDTTRYALNEALNTPLRHVGFEQEQQEIQAYIGLLEEKLASAAPENKNEVKAELEAQKRRYQLREEESWRISQETIDIYRELAKHLVVPLNSIFPNDVLSGGGEVIEQVIGRFVDGQLTVEQFVKELNGKAEMMFKENK